MFDWLRSLFDQPDPTADDGEDEDVPQEKTETETTTVTMEFTEYRVRISYDDRTETKYVTGWRNCGESYQFYEGEPELYAHGSWDYKLMKRLNQPLIKMDEGEPFVVSMSKAESIDIDKSDEFVAVVEDVEVTKHYRRNDDGEWEEHYTDFEMPDEYEVTEWYKYEWEAENE